MKLLIVKPSSLGDIVHGLLVAATARAQLPELEINWVVSDRFAALVEASPDVNRAIHFDRRGGAGAFWNLLSRIREEPYDLVWDLQGLLRSGLMTAAARAPDKWGRVDGREGAPLFFRKVPAPPGGFPAHAVDILAQFLPTLGLEARVTEPVRLKAPEAFPWKPFFTRAEGPVFVLFPDSRGAHKEWLGFADLSRLLLGRWAGCRVCWCGGGRMEPDFAAEAGERFLNLTGCPLPEMLALYAEEAVFVCNDSGPLHLAAATGKRVLGVFGPTPPERFGPYPLEDPKHRVVQAPGGDLSRLRPEAVAEALEPWGR